MSPRGKQESVASPCRGGRLQPSRGRPSAATLSRNTLMCALAPCSSTPGPSSGKALAAPCPMHPFPLLPPLHPYNPPTPHVPEHRAITCFLVGLPTGSELRRPASQGGAQDVSPLRRVPEGDLGSTALHSRLQPVWMVAGEQGDGGHPPSKDSGCGNHPTSPSCHPSCPPVPRAAAFAPLSFSPGCCTG